MACSRPPLKRCLFFFLPLNSGCYRKNYGMKGYGFGQGGPALLCADANGGDAPDHVPATAKAIDTTTIPAAPGEGCPRCQGQVGSIQNNCYTQVLDLLLRKKAPFSKELFPHSHTVVLIKISSEVKSLVLLQPTFVLRIA